MIFQLILIAILNLNGYNSVDYFKYDRQTRQEGSGAQNKDRYSVNNLILKCPKQEFIHPCDCLELDKRVEGEFGASSGDASSESATIAAQTIETPIEDSIHPDLIETVAFCKNIRNVQVLTDAIKGFQGHRVNYFVLDGCKLPPFPNNLFTGVHVIWMEILNSTLQFHENFFNTKGCT